MDNPLHLYKKPFGKRIRKADRACTVEPTANVVKQRETYFAFKLDSNVMLAPDLQYMLIRHVTGQEMDENEWRPYIAQRRQQQWEACLAGNGGGDYYRSDLPAIAAKFWYLFDLEDGVEVDDIPGSTLDRIVSELYGILWRSHVIAPPTGMPTVFNQQTVVADASSVHSDGVDESSNGDTDSGVYDAGWLRGDQEALPNSLAGSNDFPCHT